MSKRKWTMTGMLFGGLMALICMLVGFLLHEELVWYTIKSKHEEGREQESPAQDSPGPHGSGAAQGAGSQGAEAPAP